MKTEQQNTEWKEQWRDEYIKWIGGFANAQGGKLYIGVDDNGVVTGLRDTKRLLEDIPNKVKDILGILVDVNLLTKNKKPYLEIVVEPYPYPISYKGQYFTRSGSTKQELKGAALDKFLLQRQGRRWDGVAQPYVKPKELSQEAFDLFRSKAKNSKRLPSETIREKRELLLEKLHLTTDSHHLKRAALLLFHRDPEKFITGAYVKIGFFITDDELVYQDEIHGHLFEQVEKTMELLLTKYLTASISYKGIQRIETYPIPETALREAVINAIVHKDYGSGNPIQISVYNDKLIVWNAGQLPDDWTVERLKSKHPSWPFNPDVANAFFRAGLIEAWGRGTIKIADDCRKAKAQAPIFKYDWMGFIVEFGYKSKQGSFIKKNVRTASIPNQVLHLLQANNSMTRNELAKELGVSLATLKRVISQLQAENKIVREGSDKTGVWKVLTKK